MGRFFAFKKCWPRYKKLKKIFDIGKERINNEMNVIEMIKIIRKVRILLKHQSKNDHLIYSDILADEQGIIKLDDQSQDNLSLFF